MKRVFRIGGVVLLVAAIAFVGYWAVSRPSVGEAQAEAPETLTAVTTATLAMITAGATSRWGLEEPFMQVATLR